MRRIKGRVQNNLVVLEEGVRLADGTEVDVLLPARSRKLKAAVRCLLANPITRAVGIDEIIGENKRELDWR